MSEDRDRALRIVAIIVMVAILACIPGGIVLALYFDTGWWLLLSVGAFVFFMAGT